MIDWIILPHPNLLNPKRRTARNGTVNIHMARSCCMQEVGGVEKGIRRSPNVNPMDDDAIRDAATLDLPGPDAILPMRARDAEMDEAGERMDATEKRAGGIIREEPSGMDSAMRIIPTEMIGAQSPSTAKQNETGERIMAVEIIVETGMDRALRVDRKTSMKSMASAIRGT